MHSRFVYFPYLAVIFTSTFGKCPPREMIPDCYCTSGDNFNSNGYMQVQCFNITELESFKQQWQNFAGLIKKHTSLLLTYFNIPYIPFGTFNGTILRSLTIVNSKLRRLSSSNFSRPNIFEGLEHSLVSFAARGCTDVDFWDWKQFSVLKRLKYITLQSCEIKLMNSLLPISRLPLMSFQIDSVYNTVSFPKIMLFGELSSFGVINSPIERLQRNWFSSPANSLHYISLRNTSLFSIPADMFDAMPVLRYLDLSKNQIQTISEQTFHPVMHNLNVLLIHGNPLHCDAHILWLTRTLDTSSLAHDRRTRRLLTTVRSLLCQSPEKLRGKTLGSVFETDLEVDNELA